MKSSKKSAVPEDYVQYRWQAGEQLRYHAAAGILLAIAGYLFYHSIFLSLALTLFSVPIKKYYMKELAARRKAELTDQFRDVLDSLSSSVAAGRQLTAALLEAEENLSLIYAPNTPMMLELAQMGRRIRESRENEGAILMDFARRCHVEDIRVFVEVCGICRTSGGDLQRVVCGASELLRDKLAIRREIRMLTAQRLLEAKLLTAIPFAVIVFLEFASPDYLVPMYTTGMGRGLMTLSLLGIGAAYSLSVKLIHIDV